MDRHDKIPLPKHWPNHVKSALLHAIGLASMAFTSARALAGKRHSSLVRLKAELEEARTDIAFFNEEIAIKRKRLGRIPPLPTSLLSSGATHAHPEDQSRPRLVFTSSSTGFPTRYANHLFLVEANP